MGNGCQEHMALGTHIKDNNGLHSLSAYYVPDAVLAFLEVFINLRVGIMKISIFLFCFLIFNFL